MTRIRRRWGGWQVHTKDPYQTRWYWRATFANRYDAEVYANGFE